MTSYQIIIINLNHGAFSQWYIFPAFPRNWNQVVWIKGLLLLGRLVGSGEYYWESESFCYGSDSSSPNGEKYRKFIGNLFTITKQFIRIRNFSTFSALSTRQDSDKEKRTGKICKKSHIFNDKKRPKRYFIGKYFHIILKGGIKSGNVWSQMRTSIEAVRHTQATKQFWTAISHWISQTPP